MQKVYYVECPSCRKEYYLHRTLYEIAVVNPGQKLKCPFCKTDFLSKEIDLPPAH